MAAITPPGRRRIEDLLARYAWAFDVADMDTVGDCLTEDATFTIEIARAGRIVTRRGRLNIVTAFATTARSTATASGTPLRHVVTNVAWDPIDGDHAVASSYMPTFRIDESGLRPVSLSRCVDQVVLQDGGWRFEARRLIFDTPMSTDTPFFILPGVADGEP